MKPFSNWNPPIFVTKEPIQNFVNLRQLLPGFRITVPRRRKIWPPQFLSADKGRALTPLRPIDKYVTGTVPSLEPIIAFSCKSFARMQDKITMIVFLK